MNDAFVIVEDHRKGEVFCNIINADMDKHFGGMAIDNFIEPLQDAKSIIAGDAPVFDV